MERKYKSGVLPILPEKKLRRRNRKEYIMSEKQYKEYICKMVDEITNMKYLKAIYTFVHTFFISEDR